MVANGIFGEAEPRFVFALAHEPQRAATQCQPIGVVRLPRDWRAPGDDWALVLLVHEIGHWRQCLSGAPVEECAPSYVAAGFAAHRGWFTLARVYDDYARSHACAAWESYFGT